MEISERFNFQGILYVIILQINYWSLSSNWNAIIRSLLQSKLKKKALKVQILGKEKAIFSLCLKKYIRRNSLSEFFSLIVNLP